jgi:hypothetical protein
VLVSFRLGAKARITNAGSLASRDRSPIPHTSTTPRGSEEAVCTCLCPCLRVDRGLIANVSALINSY